MLAKQKLWAVAVGVDMSPAGAMCPLLCSDFVALVPYPHGVLQWISPSSARGIWNASKAALNFGNPIN